MGQIGLVGEDEEKRLSLIKRLDNYFLELNRPDIFREDDINNALVLFEAQFQNALSGLEANNVNTKDITVMQLYSHFNYFKSQQKPKN